MVSLGLNEFGEEEKTTWEHSKYNMYFIIKTTDAAIWTKWHVYMGT